MIYGWSLLRHFFLTTKNVGQTYKSVKVTNFEN